MPCVVYHPRSQYVTELWHAVISTVLFEQDTQFEESLSQKGECLVCCRDNESQCSFHLIRSTGPQDK